MHCSWHPPVTARPGTIQAWHYRHYPGSGRTCDMALVAEECAGLLALPDHPVPAHLPWRPAMTVEFGLALENFTPATKVPDMDAVSAYSVTAEELGFASVWAWDHLFLGARRPFPFLEALTTLSMVAARTSRIVLGTGILVLPIREPAILAKTAATIQAGSGGRLMLGVAAGWYEREFHATAVPFAQRGQIFERNLDLLYRLWAEDDVTGEWDGRVLSHVRMLPKPDPRLRRAGRPRPGPAQPGRAGPAVHRRVLRGSEPAGQRVRRRLLRRAGLERGDAGVGGPRHARAVRRADRRLPRGRREAPGVLPVQLPGRTGAPAGRRGAAAARFPGAGNEPGGLMEHVAVLPDMRTARAEREASGRLAVDKRMTAEAAVQLVRD